MFRSLFFLFCSFSFLAGAEPLSLGEKLDLQWRKYQIARETLLANVRTTALPVEKRLISRSEWEEIVTLIGPEDFTKSDLAQLRNLQAARIKDSKAHAAKNSVIDLEFVRSQNLAKQFCEQVPKGAMLHIHPFGTLDRQTARALMQALNPVLDFKELFNDFDRPGSGAMIYPPERTWLENIPDQTQFLSLSSQDQKRFEDFLFLPAGKQPFPRFNAVFNFLGFAIVDWESYEKVLKTFAKKARRMGVIYVEFTTGSGAALSQRLKKIEVETGLVIRVNHAFARSDDVRLMDEELDLLLKAPHDPFTVGIDFLDNEELYPALEKGQMLYGKVLDAVLSGQSHLRRTMHAGEIGDIRNPRDALIMGVERLGHGVNLAKDTVALEYASIHKIPVEVNLSSNLRLTSVPSIAEHPFLDFLRLGLRVSLSTDDEGIFEIDINNECELAVQQTDLSYAEFKQMAFNGLETSFAADTDKMKLIRQLEKMFTDFEKAKSTRGFMRRPTGL